MFIYPTGVYNKGSWAAWGEGLVLLNMEVEYEDTPVRTAASSPSRTGACTVPSPLHQQESTTESSITTMGRMARKDGKPKPGGQTAQSV